MIISEIVATSRLEGHDKEKQAKSEGLNWIRMKFELVEIKQTIVHTRDRKLQEKQ